MVNIHVPRFWKDKWELRHLGGLVELLQRGIGDEVWPGLSGVSSQWVSHRESLLTQTTRPTPKALNSAGLEGAWEGVFLTSSQVKLMLPMGDYTLRTTAPGSPFHVHKVKRRPREGKGLAPNLTIVGCCIAAGVRTILQSPALSCFLGAILWRTRDGEATFWPPAGHVRCQIIQLFRFLSATAWSLAGLSLSLYAPMKREDFSALYWSPKLPSHIQPLHFYVQFNNHSWNTCLQICDHLDINTNGIFFFFFETWLFQFSSVLCQVEASSR